VTGVGWPATEKWPSSTAGMNIGSSRGAGICEGARRSGARRPIQPGF
jgi:hypothetical protein